MSINLIQTVRSALPDGVKQQLSAHFGLTPEATERIVGASLAPLVAALMSRATSVDGSRSLFTSILTPEVNAHIADELPRLLATAPGVSQIAMSGRRLLEQAIGRRVDSLGETVAAQAGTPLYATYAFTGILGAVVLGLMKRHLLSTHGGVAQLPTLLGHQLTAIGAQLKDGPMLSLGLGAAAPFVGHIMQQLIAVSSQLAAPAVAADAAEPAVPVAPVAPPALPVLDTPLAAPAGATPVQTLGVEPATPRVSAAEEARGAHPFAWVWWLLALLALIAAALAFMPERDRNSLIGVGGAQGGAAASTVAAASSAAPSSGAAGTQAAQAARSDDASAVAAPASAVGPTQAGAGQTTDPSAPHARVRWSSQSGASAVVPASAPRAAVASDATAASAAPAASASNDIAPRASGQADTPAPVATLLRSFRDAIDALLAPGASCETAVITRVMNMAPVRFASEDAQVSKPASAALQQSARVLNACVKKFAPARIEIAGYSDNAGSAATSLALSKARANAVRGVLIDAGVPASTLFARGYGQLRPVAPNDTELGRSQNRRVEFVPERD